MDVHKESISIAVRNTAGKIVMESVIETKASMILEFVEGLRGDVHVTFEEGTWAAWLYDLLKPRVTRLVVCDPRRNALLQEGNQNDRVDARKLAELLQNNQLRSVSGFPGYWSLSQPAICCGDQSCFSLPVTIRCNSRFLASRALADAPTPKLPSPLERPDKAAVPHAGPLPGLPWKRLGASFWRWREMYNPQRHLAKSLHAHRN
jgi:hypothetical protein